jgi:hypothetical protein
VSAAAVVAAATVSTALPLVSQTVVRQRLVLLLLEDLERGGVGLLGAQLPSKYLETFGQALRLEVSLRVET